MGFYIGPRSYDYYLGNEELRDLRNARKSHDWQEVAGCGERASQYKFKDADTLQEWVILRSYWTDVLAYCPDTGEAVKLWDGWSATTAKHIHKFLAQWNKRGWSKKDWQDIAWGELVEVA